MSIEWLRDFAVCFLGFIGTITFIFVGVLVFLLYRKLSPMLDSMRNTARTVADLSSCVEEEVARPLARMVAVVHGVTQAVSLLGRFTRKRKGGRHE